MKRLSTYLTVGCILCGYCGVAVAGTSIISNVLTQSNSYLKEAGLVQKKYSGIARQYASMKVGIPDNLGGAQVAAARAQAEGVQEQANRAQEQIAMAQEAQANAMAKVADMNAKMVSAMEKAQSGLAEGIAITEQYKTSITESVNTVKNAPDIAKGLADRAVNSVKDTAMGTVNSLKDTANSVKDQATGIAGDVTSSSGKKDNTSGNEVDDEQNNVVDEDVSEVGTYRQPVSTSQIYGASAEQVPTAVALQPERAVVQTEQPRVSVSNQAAAIQSAAVMADSAVVSGADVQALSGLAELPVAETTVSAADVMAAATASQPMKEVEAEIQHSRLNIEEQLQQSSNRIDANNMRRVNQKKIILDKNGKAEPLIEKQTVRRRFDKPQEELKAEIKDISNKEAVAEKKTKLLDTAVQNLNPARKKAIIRENAHE